MNKKFINLLLASVLTAGSVQVFTSCKDNEADLRNEIQTTYESLEARVAHNEELLAALPGQLEALKNQLTNDINAAKSELQNQLNEFNTKFENALKAQGEKIDNLSKDLADYIIKNDAELANLQTQITNNFNKIANLEADLTLVTNRVTALENTVTDQGNRLVTVEGALAETQAALAQLTTDFTSYKEATDGRLEALETFKNSWESLLPEIQQNAADALAKANANAASIEAINGVIEELKATDAAQQVLIDDILEKLKGFVSTEDFNQAIEDLKAKDAEIEQLAKDNYKKAIGYTNLMIEQVLATMNAKFDAVNGEITDIKEFQANLANEVAKNAQAISALQADMNNVNIKIGELADALNAVTGRIDEIEGRITSIVLQGTKDEVFGSLRLPIGIQSNLLVSYFGEVANAAGEVTFPLVAKTGSTYNGDISNALTEEEAEALGVSDVEGAHQRVPIQTISGLFMKEAANGNGYLGKVYATINPSSVDVQNPKFEYSMVNSRGEKVAEPLKFAPCDEMLTHGFTRSDNNNGFYAADATVKIDEASINSIRFHFDDNLKNAVREILKAPRANANKQTVLKLANLVYDQLNGFLPAIGVEASWNDSKNGDMKVTSNYGIATATVNPLSFTFLYGITPGHHIPTIMPALDKIQDKFNVVFDELTGDLKIELVGPDDKLEIGGITLAPPTVTVPSMASKPVVIDIKPIVIDGEEKFAGYYQEIDVSGDINGILDQLRTDLQKSLSESFDKTNAELAAFTNDIAEQVNGLIEKMQTNVNSTIDEVLTNIKDKVNGVFNSGTVNSIVNRLDGIINKLNTMMDNANYYLQPVLLYDNNGDYGMVSTSEAWPSVMVLNGDANAIAILPTTYTYETVVPIFKKYVAVTKVWANGDKDKQNLISIALEANDNTKFNTNMNKVINSNVREIALKLQKGYTYEVFYQAVDYSGYVSGRKYYICVK